MTINIAFLTITFKKRKRTMEEMLHQETIEQLYEQHKNRQFSLYRIM
ncbi:YrzI family small protein [Neobacillus sp. YIM B02564]|uniref:YrzI family small protein n=1 Tax=Neobacillus paridis TaxID=2803862 RepID=A0ABS1TP16_9BACI|nr:YrzI family small protein [Neobacillus paridis]MBL4953027.1 YrzI family small protein [Neobacillus paridis]